MKVFPNPTQDVLYIENENATPIDNYKLFNLVGDKMLVELKENKINHLPAGVYLLYLKCKRDSL